MATGGQNVNSFANDPVKRSMNLCNHCHEDGKSKVAVSFCCNCGMYFCQSCNKLHLRLAPDHKGEELVHKGQQSLACSMHTSESVEFYCEQHNSVFCRLCRDLEHKTCLVQDLSAVLSDNDIMQEFRMSHTDLLKLVQLTDEIHHEKQLILDTFCKETGELRDKIEFLRKEINEVFDGFQMQISLQDQLLIGAFSVAIETCTEFKDQLKSQIRRMERAKGNRTKEMLLTRESKRMYNEYSEILQDIRYVEIYYNMNFKNVDKLPNLLQEIFQLANRGESFEYIENCAKAEDQEKTVKSSRKRTKKDGNAVPRQKFVDSEKLNEDHSIEELNARPQQSTDESREYNEDLAKADVTPGPRRIPVESEAFNAKSIKKQVNAMPRQKTVESEEFHAHCTTTETNVKARQAHLKSEECNASLHTDKISTISLQKNVKSKEFHANRTTDKMDAIPPQKTIKPEECSNKNQTKEAENAIPRQMIMKSEQLNANHTTDKLNGIPRQVTDESVEFNANHTTDEWNAIPRQMAAKTEAFNTHRNKGEVNAIAQQKTNNTEIVREDRTDADMCEGPLTKSFLDIGSLSFVQEANVRVRVDENLPMITSCKWLPGDGGVILCDNNNGNIKLMDKNLNITFNVRCKSSPFDIDFTDDNSGIITLPEARSLQFITIKPGFKFKHLKSLKLKCYGIAANGNNIYVCIDDPQQSVRCVKILTAKGEFVSYITHTGVGSPKHLYVNMDGSRIYYTGGFDTEMFINCVTQNGFGIFSVTGPELLSPKTVSGDEDGNILVADDKAKCFQIISSYGVIGKKLDLAEETQSGPKASAVNKAKGALIVSFWETNPYISKVVLYSLNFA